MRSFRCHHLFNNPAHKKFVSLGPHSTASKVIFNIVEEWIKKNNLDQKSSFEIEDMSLIIDNFASAITNIIDYSLYKKQTKEIKRDIKDILSDILGDITRASDASFNEIGNSGILKHRKLHYYAKNKSHNEFVSVFKEKHTIFQIKFPNTPFYDKNELENHVTSALEGKYAYLLLKNQNPDDFHQTISPHFFQHLPGTKTLSEKILSEMVKRWVKEHPNKYESEVKDWIILINTLQTAFDKTLDYLVYKKQPKKYKNDVFEALVTRLMTIAKQSCINLTKIGTFKSIQQIGIQYINEHEYQDEHLTSLQVNNRTWIKLPDEPFYSKSNLSEQIIIALYPKYKLILNSKIVQNLGSAPLPDNNNEDVINVTVLAKYDLIESYEAGCSSSSVLKI